jgi:dUTP pyrophosphatase
MTDRVLMQQLDTRLPVPYRAHADDAGVDLYSTESFVLNPQERYLVGTGVALAIPVGTVGLIHPRSGLATKYGLTVLNTPGTIDSGYRGEVKVCLINLSNEFVYIQRGDKIAQLLIQKVELPDFVLTRELPESDRGESGFGSTGGHAGL